jgi:hypothetical protein
LAQWAGTGGNWSGLAQWAGTSENWLGLDILGAGGLKPMRAAENLNL